MGYSLIWIISIICFLALEAATSYLVSIWFAGGAVAALLCSVFSDNLSLQILVFLVVSLLCVAFVRNIAMKFFKKTNIKTNTERLIGEVTVVKETVDNLKNTGIVVINGIEWKVKSEENLIIEENQKVEITAIEGVKLVVKIKED